MSQDLRKTTARTHNMSTIYTQFQTIMEACKAGITPVSTSNVTSLSFHVLTPKIFFIDLAFCRNYGLKKWYKFDDHTVSTLDKSDVKSSATYILFYTSLPDSAFIAGR